MEMRSIFIANFIGVMCNFKCNQKIIFMYDIHEYNFFVTFKITHCVTPVLIFEFWN